MLKNVIDDVITVSDNDVKNAIRQLALKNKLIAEGSGALALAAAQNTPVEKRGLSVCIISGGSIDAEKLAGILQSRDT